MSYEKDRFGSKEKLKKSQKCAKVNPGESLIKVNPKDLEAFFPTQDENALDKIQLTEEALYSTTTLSHANYIRDSIKMFYHEDKHKDLVITDANSCIGGTIMATIIPFGKINAVELNPTHARLMENNLKVIFGEYFKKITIINDNFLNVWNTFRPKSNVMIMDPPWGGCDYYKVKKLKLYLNDKDGNPVEMVDIINMVIDETDMVVVRVPFNYDMERLDMIKFPYSYNLQFLKKYPKTDRKRAGKIKTLYYMYIFSHIEPVGNLDDLDPHAYYAEVNYRDIEFNKV